MNLSYGEIVKLNVGGRRWVYKNNLEFKAWYTSCFIVWQVIHSHCKIVETKEWTSLELEASPEHTFSFLVDWFRLFFFFNVRQSRLVSIQSINSRLIYIVCVDYLINLLQFIHLKLPFGGIKKKKFDRSCFSGLKWRHWFDTGSRPQGVELCSIPGILLKRVIF